MGCAVSKRLKTHLNKQENRPIVVRTETQPSSSIPTAEETNSQKEWCLQQIEEWRQEREESSTSSKLAWEWVMEKMNDGDKMEEVKEEAKKETREDFLKRINLDKEMRKRMVIRDDTILELPFRMPTLDFDDE